MEDKMKKLAFVLASAMAIALTHAFAATVLTEEQKLLADPKWSDKHANPVLQRMWRKALDRDILNSQREFWQSVVQGTASSRSATR